MVISLDLHNKKQKMIFACPINGRYNDTSGFIMCEQLKTIDYEERGVRLIDRANDEILAEVLKTPDLIIWGG